MKKLNLLSIMLIFGVIIFNSCEEGLDVNVNTTFKKTITADVQNDLKSVDTVISIPFYAIDTMDITDDDKVQENLDKFKDLQISKITCSLTGIPEGESITELNITIPEAFLSITLANISENNNSISLEVSPELLDALASFLHSNYQVTIQVSGFSSYAPMLLGVDLSFESTIITEL